MFHNEIQPVHLDGICELQGRTEVYTDLFVLIVCGFCVCVLKTFTRCDMYVKYEFIVFRLIPTCSYTPVIDKLLL